MNSKLRFRLAAFAVSAAMALGTVSPAAIYGTAQFPDEAGASTVSDSDSKVAIEDFVTRLYMNFFGRNPDRTGFPKWVNLLVDRKVTGVDVILGFYESREFQRKELSDEDFINIVYRTVFGRDVDRRGRAAWLGVLENGCTRYKVMEGLLNSQEMQRQCEAMKVETGSFTSTEIVDVNYDVTLFVARMYRLVLDRKPDKNGIRRWVEALVGGNATGADIAYGFFNSKEYNERSHDNETFIRTLYAALLDREPDSKGLASWTAALEEHDRKEVIMGFAQSREFYRLCKGYGIFSGYEPAPPGGVVTHYFPEKNPEFEIDKLDQFGTYYTGLWEGSMVDLDGRTYKIYVPEGCRRDASCYYIAVPDRVDTVEFLVETGWIEIANRDKIVLSIFEPENERWGSVQDEDEYFNAAFAMFSGTEYVYHDIFNWRWIGYGEGGEMMQRYIMKNPLTAASAVFVNASNTLYPEELDVIASEKYTVKGSTLDITKGETPVPVWIFNEPNESAQAVVDYWLTANDCDREAAISAAGNTVIMNQKPFSNSIFTYDQKVGTVVNTRHSVDYYDKDNTQVMYSWLGRYARSGTGSPYSNSLTRSVSDDTFVREDAVVDGWHREWFIYVPSTYDYDQSLPLVIFYHGTGQSGLLAQRQGDWWKVAEEKKFIAVCPSASLENVRAAGKVPQMSWNVEGYGNADDITFTKFLINHMAADYNIDRGRVYVTGQSNGGRMAIYAGLALPKDVTAVASAGASALTTGNYGLTVEPGRYYLPEDLDESSIVPFLATIGQFDNFTYDVNQVGSDSWLRTKYLTDRYGLEFNRQFFYSNGLNDYTVWQNSQGVPLVGQIVVGLRAHSHRPLENWIIWNEWFVKYSKDTESGRLYYMGLPVEG
jgi:predicted esterase